MDVDNESLMTIIETLKVLVDNINNKPKYLKPIIVNSVEDITNEEMEGSILYNKTTKQFYGYNGQTWHPIKFNIPTNKSV